MCVCVAYISPYGQDSALYKYVTEQKYYFNRYINNIVKKKRNTKCRLGLAYKLQAQVFNIKVYRVIDFLVNCVLLDLAKLLLKWSLQVSCSSLLSRIKSLAEETVLLRGRAELSKQIVSLLWQVCQK